MLAPAYPIRTPRLLLRPIDPVGDLDAAFAYQSREDVCRWIPYAPRTREEVAERLADPTRARSTLEEPGQVLNLAVVIAATGEMIGDVVLFWHSAEHRSGEIGYVITPAQQGNGYATEVCGALLQLAFDGLGLHRVVGRLDAENLASAAVLRRAGLRHEATLVDNEWFKGRWSTEMSFAMLESEWRARVPSAD